MSLHGTGDSDDDEDFARTIEDEEKASATSSRGWTLNRFNSSLSDSSPQTRVTALTALHSVVKTLTSALPPLTPMDLPPPYDPSRIVLTYNPNSGVGDLPSADHAPHWAVWQKVHSGLMDQFLEDKTAVTKDTPSEVPLSLSLAPQSEEVVRTQLQALLDGLSSSLFKRFSDTSEKCRSLALLTTTLLVSSAPDLTKHISYLLPAVMQRYPPAYFDQDTDVFIHDMSDHENFRRGVAASRQDKADIVHGARSVTVVEKSEEVRLLLTSLISSLLTACLNFGSLATLNPYFTDLVLLLQSQLRDPYPLLKVKSSLTLVQLLRVPQWESGAMIFATATARAAIPNLRSRNAKIRMASLALFEAAIGVPNRGKVKGAGTAAIVDVVGFREENVLPIAAFYSADCGVSVNALAEIVQDGNPSVRARACAMLCFFLVCLPDRYDHHTRLLPYVMSFFNDDIQSTRDMAVQAVEHCGGQFEAEHPDDIIERRQYGVDGDKRTNHKALLPEPFTKRPRLGARIFVRGNTKRFFQALMGELTNWIAVTRDRSASLVVSLVVYCEEHLTMDFHDTLPQLVKALGLAKKEEEGGEAGAEGKQMLEKMEYILELMGRFVDPETYVALLLPRITGAAASATTFSEGGFHSDESRAVHAAALRCMMKGSLTARLLPHVKSMVKEICEDSDSLTADVSAGTRQAVLECLVTLLSKIRGVDGKLLTSHFNATGRLADLGGIWTACCKRLLTCLYNGDGDGRLREITERGLDALGSGEGR